MSAKFATAAEAREFMLGGSATVTIASARTGVRFTFKVNASDNPSLWFVQLMNGADNESDFAYMGTIRDGAYRPGHPNKTRVGASAPSAKAFAWTWERLAADRLPDGLEIWHEGRCGRCNRKLTVPDSVEAGFGPDCSEHRAKARRCVAA